MTREDMWDALVKLGVPEYALVLITCINGYSQRTLESVLWAHTNCFSFDQIGE